MNSIAKKVAVVGALFGSAGSVFAAEIDATAITTAINDVVPVVTSVGMALLSVYVVVKAFRLIGGFLGGR